jgi:hypothetical protein
LSFLPQGFRDRVERSQLLAAATTGNSTALRPSAPCSIVTVAFL